MIELVDVKKIYKKGKIDVSALRGVTMQVEEGEFLSIMGPSGSGKTTLLNAIGLLDEPSSGTICLFGNEASGLGRRDQARLRGTAIGFVFQSFNLVSNLQAWQNVALPLRYAHVARADRRKRAIEALGLVGLQDRADHYPSELSGGEEQRVAIARSLVIDPKLILADEPTGNLDSGSGNDVMKQFQLVNSLGTTLIVVTHDVLVSPYARRHLGMLDGRIESDEMAPSAN
ncbi:MAG: ABC transporter ATP-binding protein [Candidatus Atribacteria bacterium]|nr:MAG: ABC transporter ATP-binding protein [Candidatus Atribacteria bacterium]